MKQQASEFKVEERGIAWLYVLAFEFRKTFEVCLKSTIFWLLFSLTDGRKVKSLSKRHQEPLLDTFLKKGTRRLRATVL